MRAGSISGCVFFSARAILRVGIHTVCVLSAWEQNTQSQLSRELPALRVFVTAYACSRRSLFEEGAFTSVPHGAGPHLSRRSGGCARGNRRWIRWGEWRRASPYLLPLPPDPAPALWEAPSAWEAKGKPPLHAQGHAAMPTWLRHVEETLVLVSRPGVGSSLLPRITSDGRVTHRLGSGHKWPPCPRSVERSPSHVAHQLPGDAGRVSSTETLPPGPIDHHVLVRTDNTAVVSYINHQGGLCSRPLYRLAHQILVWSQGKLLSLRSVHIPGHLNMGADILSRQGPRPGEWMLHPEVVKQICRFFWPGSGGPVATWKTSHCPLWFSLTHPAPLGLDALVQTWPRLSLYTLVWTPWSGDSSLHGAETASSTQSTARLVQCWSSCRPKSLQGWPTPP